MYCACDPVNDMTNVSEVKCAGLSVDRRLPGLGVLHEVDHTTLDVLQRIFAKKFLCR